MSDETAEKFIEDIDKAKAEVLKLQQSNIDKVRSLNAAGKSLDLAALANIKVDTIIATFFDESAQVVYLRNLEMKVREALDAALAEIRQEQLTQGVTGNGKGLIIPR